MQTEKDTNSRVIAPNCNDGPLLEYHHYRWDRGAFRQNDLTPTKVYDAKYMEYYASMKAASRALSARRLKVLETFSDGSEAWLLDYGCGAGHFVDAAAQSGWGAYGCDMVNCGVSDFLATDAALRRNPWHVVTFFDSLEHLPDPAGTIAALSPRLLMISVPECHFAHQREWFMAWKHRKPGEHLWHWDRRGLDEFVGLLGYRAVMHSWFEDEFRTPYDPAMSNILTAIYRRKK